jgi:hypothetical protein
MRVCRQGGAAAVSKLNALETREPNEAAHIREMTDILRRKMERDYPQGRTRRDAHPKTLGVLKGSFAIEPGLPAELRIGLFAKARTFDCWIRFSNASGTIQPDSVRDARGIAIKLMAARRKSSTVDATLGQDFVLLDSPAMPLGTVALFRDAVYYAIESSPLLLGAKLLLSGNVGVLLSLLGLLGRPNSPLDIRYWSTTPYLLGADRAVKYALIPTARHRSRRPESFGDAYLTDAMEAHLTRHVASFDFCVQLRHDNMPIEDAGLRWSEQDSPFVKVATLHIPKQKFRNKARHDLRESLSFSPAHALPEHAPIGGLNRARAAIYAALSKFRHQRDAITDIA